MGNYERKDESGPGAQASKAIEFGGIVDVVYLTSAGRSVVPGIWLADDLGCGFSHHRGWPGVTETCAAAKRNGVHDGSKVAAGCDWHSCTSPARPSPTAARDW